RSWRNRFDLWGMLLLTALVVPLLLAVSQLQHPSKAGLPLLGGLLGLAVLSLLVLIAQQRRCDAPLLALPLLRLPAFWRSDLMATCSGASLTALMTFLPI